MPPRKPRSPDTIVLNRRQTNVLASAARLEILEAFDAQGRASARELAAHLGRSPGAVYHHVRTLEQAGLIREVARRPGRRRPEAVYAPAAERMAVAGGQQPGDMGQAARVARAVFRQAARDVDASFARGPSFLRGRFHGLQLSGPLTEDEVKRVLTWLRKVEGIVRRANRRRGHGGDIYRWTSVFLPVRKGRS